jgi:hypothetical protein
MNTTTQRIQIYKSSLNIKRESETKPIAPPEPDKTVDDFIPVLKGIYEAGKTWPGDGEPFEINDIIITNPNEYRVLKSYRQSVDDHVNNMTKSLIKDFEKGGGDTSGKPAGVMGNSLGDQEKPAPPTYTS